MKLQLALDDITMVKAIELLEQISDNVDIIEIGTPFLMQYGLEAVRTVKNRFPDKEILCDAKIADGGAIEANAAFSAGADYITVLGIADKATIEAVIEAAKIHHKYVVADLLYVEDFKKSLTALEDLSVDMVAVHTGVDQQRFGRTPLEDLKRIKPIAKKVQVAVAGGINSATLPLYIEQNPDVIIVGNAITKAIRPQTEVESIYKQIKEAK